MIQAITSLKDIAPITWDILVDADKNPFASHGFLHGLEKSDSIGQRTGWFPQFYIKKNDTGDLIGALISYEKHNSYGEYVFDHAWADAYQRHGMAYYPKMQAAIPFTPATCPKLFGDDIVKKELLSCLIEHTQNNNLSSAHMTFLSDEDLPLFDENWLERWGCQYYWHNDNYNSFDDFLASQKRSRRKFIKKERAAIQAMIDACELEIKTHHGDGLTKDAMQSFYPFYRQTIDKKWSAAYLTEGFFLSIAETMADKIVLMIAYKNGQPIAGALNFLGTETLFGRYWGASTDVPFLHFELCYYRAIDFSIEKKLKVVEAGAQGQHKIKRGYKPTKILSMHYLAHDTFKDAVADFLSHEKKDIEHYINHVE